MSYKYIRQLTALLLLLSIAGICYLPFANLHMHVLPDGRIEIHSHSLPGQSSRKEHQHSQQEVTVYKAFGKILESDAFVFDCMTDFDLNVIDVFDNHLCSKYSEVYIPLDNERAPPRYLFS